MPSTSGTRSCWLDAPLRLERLPIRADAEADVCIIGAGIAGLLCAHTLLQRGLRPLIIDDGPIGGGETGRTTAHLSNAVDDRYFHIERIHGAESARLSADSHTAAIDLIENIVREQGIDCDFARVPGYLFLPPGERRETLAREQEAAHRAGLTSVQFVDRAPSFDSGPCLLFPNQAQLHPLRFLAALAESIERRAGLIFTGTHAVRVTNGRTLTVGTAGGPTIAARSVIVATNSPFNDMVTMHTKQSARRTYAFAARIRAGLIAPALHWDTSERAGDEGGAYHYVRVQPAAPGEADDLLIVGGGDHPTGEPSADSDPWAPLESWARERWPQIGVVERRWSGQVMEPHDSLAFIGANPSGPEGVFIITGDSGMGMTHAGIAAILLPDLIQTGRHPWAALYNPARKPVAPSSLREFAHEGARVASHYADWLTPGADVDSIKPGEGNVVRRGLRLLAVHRDSSGELHTRSAVCPHLGCIVRWNGAERTWDCPCHGSRFDCQGQVLNGPAPRNLADKTF